MARPEKTHPLYRWRKQHDLTLQALASELAVTQSHLSEIENWKNEPSLDLAARLHTRTGIDMKSFVRTAESVQ